MKFTPQVRLRLGIGRIGPELEGDLLAGLGRVTVQQQVGQQGQRFGPSQRDKLIILFDARYAKKKQARR